MADYLEIKSTDEFEQMIKDKDLGISKSIVKGILENLVGKKKNIHVLEIYVESEDRIFDITCHRDDFVDTLKEVDTEGVKPLTHVNEEVTNILRDDKVGGMLSSKDALKNAQEKDSSYIKVPKVVKKN